MITKLYYNGWLQLPAGALRTLGNPRTGSSVEIVPDARGLLLRVAGPMPQAEADEPKPAAATQPAPRKPGRPRKAAASPGATSLVLPPPTRRIGGRRKGTSAPSER
jgi:hypothetical protein